MDRIEEILQKLQQGQSISQDEAAVLTEAFADNPDHPDLNAAVVAYGNTADGSKFLSDQATKLEQGKLSGKIGAGIQAILSIADIANSIGQIKQARESLETSERNRPTAPRYTRNPNIERALGQARSDATNLNTSSLTAPIRQGIEDSFQADLANSRTASTGQAGQFGTLAQGAINRRNRANLQILPFVEQARAQRNQRIDRLLGIQAQDDQRVAMGQARNYRIGVDQFNREQMAAGQLGSTGRSNLRTSLHNTAYLLGNAANAGLIPLQTNRVDQGTPSSYLSNTGERGIDQMNRDLEGFGTDIADYNQRINRGLVSRSKNLLDAIYGVGGPLEI